MVTSLIWLPAALFAGLFQAWRTALQQRLRAELSVAGAGLVRYLYGAPVALVLALAYFTVSGAHLRLVAGEVVLWAALGGLAQVIGTMLLIAAFGHRGFVVGTAFSKTEAVQAALASWALLHEVLPPLVWVGIGAGVAGVMILALAGRGLRPRDLGAALVQPAALLGLGAGAFFAITGILVRRATMALGHPDPVAGALTVLVIVLCLQTLMQGAWVSWREPATWGRALRSWRSSSQVGLLAAMGSACFFTGFAAAPVALVRVVGQVEVIFTLAFAAFYLKERVRLHEVAGLLLVATGVVLALLGAL